MDSRLKLTAFVLKIRIGCSPAERSRASRVEIDFALQFPTLPTGCRTDRLADTVCYATFCETIRALVKKREFLLIEHLAHEIFEALKPLVPRKTLLAVRVRKPKPPIPGVEGEASFELGAKGLL